MTKKEKEKQQKEAERQASVAIILEELDNLPNIDIDPAAMLAEKSSSEKTAESAADVPTHQESKKHHGTLDLSVDLYERLRLFAFQQRRSINSIVEESVNRFLDECFNASE